MYGDPQPHKLTFILKTDEEITIDGRKHAPQRKNAAGCCYDEIVEIFHFDYYSKHFKFDKCETGMRKKLVDSVHVSVAIPHYPDPLSTDDETT